MQIPFVDLKTQYQALESQIERRIKDVLEHGAFILGPEVRESEAALAEYTGAKHAVTCASGTDALVMALMAQDIGPGDEVVTTCFSWISTAEVILLVGATPVFVDIEPDTYNIDATKIEAAITERTKAILPVSLFGQPADMDEICQIAEKHGICVIEDAAQSFGAEYKGKKSSNLSPVACTSFFPAKPLGCYGDGGAVFTDDDKLAEVLKSIRIHGQGERFCHTRVGITGRMDTLQCAVLLAKLERFPWEVSARQRVAAEYDKAFTDLDWLTTPHVKADRTSVYAQYTLSVEDREGFRQALQEKGVPTGVYYPICMHEQPPYERFRTVPLNTAEKAAKSVVSIPIFADLDDPRQSYIIDAVRSFDARQSR